MSYLLNCSRITEQGLLAFVNLKVTTSVTNRPLLLEEQT